MSAPSEFFQRARGGLVAAGAAIAFLTGLAAQGAGGELPSRIVTLAPSLGTLAAAMLSPEEMDRIVGVSEYTDDPPELERVARIGRYDRFDVERVASLKPSLVFATRDGNSPDQIARLRSLSIQVVVVETDSLAKVAESLRTVGRALHRAERAEALAREFESGLSRAKARARGRAARPRRVLMLVGDAPLVTVGRRSFLHETLEVVGAKNVFDDLDQAYPRISREAALARSPEVILVVALGKDRRPFEKIARDWKRWAKAGTQVRVLDGDRLARPTPRLIEALDLLERQIVEGGAS